MINNFHFVLFIYYNYFITDNNIKNFLHFYQQTFPSATVLPKMHLLEQRVVPWLNNAAVNGLTPAHHTRSLRCSASYRNTMAKCALFRYFSSPDASSKKKKKDYLNYSTLYISLYKAFIKPFIHFHSYYFTTAQQEQCRTH